MNPEPIPRPNIVDGINDLINGRINAVTGSSESYRLPAISHALSGALPDDFDLLGLINAMWVRIESNWDTFGAKVGGDRNWRWELMPIISAANPSPEKRLEKALAKVLPATDWANQVPTASGLSLSGDGHRNIDLAHWDGSSEITLIELKVMRPQLKGDPASDTPLHAAFEIVINALLLLLARKHREIKVVEPDKWLHDDLTVHLRVLAPRAFYSAYNLRDFESKLCQSVIEFGASHNMKMSFGFCVFDLADALLDSLRYSQPRWTGPGVD